MGIIANGTPQQASALDAGTDSKSVASKSVASDPVTPEPAGADAVYDLDRLEDAITSLVDANARLREERAAIRHELGEKTERILALEGELLEANQRRQDVAKRIDELIAQMDSLDAQLESAEPANEEGE